MPGQIRRTASRTPCSLRHTIVVAEHGRGPVKLPNPLFHPNGYGVLPPLTHSSELKRWASRDGHCLVSKG